MSKTKNAEPEVKIGDIVMFFPGGDTSNSPQPLIVTQIMQGLLRGLVCENSRTVPTDGFIRNVSDPWCEDHKALVFQQGAWGTHADAK